MKTIKVPNGLISVANSSAKCPKCEKPILLSDVDEKIVAEANKGKKSKGYIRHKCQGCKRFIGVAMAYNGEVCSFELQVSLSQ
jgi:hypothetical protein